MTRLTGTRILSPDMFDLVNVNEVLRSRFCADGTVNQCKVRGLREMRLLHLQLRRWEAEVELGVLEAMTMILRIPEES